MLAFNFAVKLRMSYNKNFKVFAEKKQSIKSSAIHF